MPPDSSHESVAEKVERLEVPFGPSGIDPYGISKDYLRFAYRLLEPVYRKYFHVRVHGIENVPARGRAMVVGNHSGGVAIDGMMVLCSLFFEMSPPRLGQGMIEKFINRLPFASMLASRTGQFTGLPEHAKRLLEHDRVLMVFPEGARGTAKLYTERHSLVDFGSGFMRLALASRAPIVPFAVLGGGEAFPTIMNLYSLGKLLGAPYIPVPLYVAPIPTPACIEIHYGPPMLFEGTGDEEDGIIQAHVERVKTAIAQMIAQHKDKYEPFKWERPS